VVTHCLELFAGIRSRGAVIALLVIARSDKLTDAAVFALRLALAVVRLSFVVATFVIVQSWTWVHFLKLTQKFWTQPNPTHGNYHLTQPSRHRHLAIKIYMIIGATNHMDMLIHKIITRNSHTI